MIIGFSLRDERGAAFCSVTNYMPPRHNLFLLFFF